jgi:hypothetical protein
MVLLYYLNLGEEALWGIYLLHPRSS